ncbi:hypothetical protein [Nitrosopumilus maritimus]|uniref:Uncharacterized protein n=1 Tax=Nitrosopumilus maritimus (strain SCM1) TaxID=436308 RepID=A9A367_NITMS|nr:hypothetical protein [Nitrosopumilus maritimus]ABX12496.1 hypothetical protein Nmar_0600 [Nitrosopumilus maritimus SCM1]
MFSKEKITVAYTVEKCEKCDMQKKRKFSEGDVLFAEISKCNSCDGITVIDKIFGETLEQ